MHVYVCISVHPAMQEYKLQLPYCASHWAMPCPGRSTNQRMILGAMPSHEYGGQQYVYGPARTKPNLRLFLRCFLSAWQGRQQLASNMSVR